MTTKTVLIVVDVQNCFMAHGSLSGATLQNSVEQINEIIGLIGHPDVTDVVFTRDLHPVNHISLENPAENRIADLKYVFPEHCRDMTVKCPAKSRTDSEPPSNENQTLPQNPADSNTPLGNPNNNETPSKNPAEQRPPLGNPNDNEIVSKNLAETTYPFRGNPTSLKIDAQPKKRIWGQQPNTNANIQRNYAEKLEDLKNNPETAKYIESEEGRDSTKNSLYEQIDTAVRNNTKFPDNPNGDDDFAKYANTYNKKRYGGADSQKHKIGTELSYLYDPDYKEHYKDLITDDTTFEKITNPYYVDGISKLIYNPNDATTSIEEQQKHTIGIDPKIKQTAIENTPDLANINWNEVEPVITNKKKLIALTKGQYCNYDSYSAFNYHLHLIQQEDNTVVSTIDENTKTSIKPIDNNKELLKEFNSKTKKEEHNIINDTLNEELKEQEQEIDPKNATEIINTLHNYIIFYIEAKIINKIFEDVSETNIKDINDINKQMNHLQTDLQNMKNYLKTEKQTEKQSQLQNIIDKKQKELDKLKTQLSDITNNIIKNNLYNENNKISKHNYSKLIGKIKKVLYSNSITDKNIKSILINNIELLYSLRNKYFVESNKIGTNTNIIKENLLTPQYSTGLWEYLLKDIDKNEFTQLNIIVCGNVGNICVTHTLLQGIATWNNIYSIEYPKVDLDFLFSFIGTRWAPPNFNYNINENYTQIKDTKIIPFFHSVAKKIAILPIHNVTQTNIVKEFALISPTTKMEDIFTTVLEQFIFTDLESSNSQILPSNEIENKPLSFWEKFTGKKPTYTKTKTSPKNFTGSKNSWWNWNGGKTHKNKRKPKKSTKTVKKPPRKKSAKTIKMHKTPTRVIVYPTFSGKTKRLSHK